MGRVSIDATGLPSRVLKLLPVRCLTVSIAHHEDAPLRRQVHLASFIATDHRRRNVGVTLKRRLVVVTGVALKQRLIVGARPRAGDQTVAVGECIGVSDDHSMEGCQRWSQWRCGGWCFMTEQPQLKLCPL